MEPKMTEKVCGWLLRNEPIITAGIVICLALAVVGAAEGV